MTTVINNPSDGSGEGSGASLIIGVITVLILITLFVVYILPSLNATNTAKPEDKDLKIQVELPAAPVQDQKIEN